MENEQNQDIKQEEQEEELTLDQITTAMQNVFEHVKPLFKKGLFTFMQGVADGKKFKEIFSISPKIMERQFEKAKQLYNNGKFKEASYLFNYLSILDEKDPRFPFGMAACMHMQKHYENAARAYSICSVLDPNDPIPPYHASDCWLNMSKKNLAIESLNEAIEKAGDKTPYQALKQRCLMTLKSLRENISESGETFR